MQRRHDIDALRALAFGLLILYHLAMLYVTDWGWHLKSSYLTEALQMPMLMLNRWRMDLIFLISGISTAFLLQRSKVTGFVRERSGRLMVPLIFGMLVIVPIQPYCQGVANGLVEPGVGQFLARYYSGYPWPAKAFDGWEHGFTWNHLWYLAYLWCYTMLLALLQPLLNSQRVQGLLQVLTGLRGLKLLLLPALPLFIYTVTLQERFPNTNNLIHDWYAHAVYFTIFFYGWCLGNSETIWTELAARRKLALGLALTAGTGYLLTVRMFWGLEEVSTAEQCLIWALRNMYVWATLCAILGWAHVFLNRPWRWLPWATQAVYPWYVLHQSLIVLLAYWLVPLKLGAVAEPLLVVGGTVVGCWIITSGIVQRIQWLQPLFGLKAQR